MFLKNSSNGDLVEALDLQTVFDPFVKSIQARTQAGEDTMDVVIVAKDELVFPSGETLPLCWCDCHYLEHAT